MRLLNTQTKKLEQVIDENRNGYAILSHTWGDSEPTFQDFMQNPAPILASSKIAGLIATAEHKGVKYVWVDTICIDKTSSAELQEAINSMYKWYWSATVCYAYIEDVEDASEDIFDENSAFRASRWFTRGWTLQELLAPKRVVFYDRSWREIAQKEPFSYTRSDEGSIALLAEITGIPHALLDGHLSLSSFSVAQKMSWAAQRKTTRDEDRAYSLLGLFGVNMPMLYGEGDLAFVRLQDEIMKRSSDHSLLAFNYQGTRPRFGVCPWFPTPLSYLGCKDIIRVFLAAQKMATSQATGLEHYQMTNRGLYIQLDTLTVPGVPGMIVGRLDCIINNGNVQATEDTGIRVVVVPLLSALGPNSKIVTRTMGVPLVDLPLELFRDPQQMTTRQLYVTDGTADDRSYNTDRFRPGVHWLLSIGDQKDQYTLSEVYPPADVGFLSSWHAGISYPWRPRTICMRFAEAEGLYVDILMRIDLTFDNEMQGPALATCSVAPMPTAARSLLELLLLDEYPATEDPRGVMTCPLADPSTAEYEATLLVFDQFEVHVVVSSVSDIIKIKMTGSEKVPPGERTGDADVDRT